MTTITAGPTPHDEDVRRAVDELIAADQPLTADELADVADLPVLTAGYIALALTKSGAVTAGKVSRPNPGGARSTTSRQAYSIQGDQQQALARGIADAPFQQEAVAC